jgi:hypothetical protein
MQQGVLFREWNNAVNEAWDPNNPLWARTVMLLLAVLATPVAGAEEFVRGVGNVPYAVENFGVGAGQNIGRAYLWTQQDEWGEATVSLLSSVAQLSAGFVTAGSVAEPSLLARGGAKTPTILPETIWGQGSKIQGAGGENFIVENIPAFEHQGVKYEWKHLHGNFEDVDSVVFGPGGSSEPALAISQQKTIDTALKSYQGAGITSRIATDAEHVPWGNVYEQSGIRVEIGPDTKLFLDVMLPDRPLTPTQLNALDYAIWRAKSVNVTVRTWIVP